MNRLPLVLSVALATPLLAGQEGAVADLCRDAARIAAAQTGVPYPVLLAVTLTETGRADGEEVAPWPWTINDSGEGYWFASRAEAEIHAAAALASGRTSFDLGCFQINYRWHGGSFPSIGVMMSPVENAVYAAEFLGELYAESGDWSVAAGAYHSRDDVHAARYRARFDALYAVALASVEPAGPVRMPGRDNEFPLLQPGEGRRAPGSLVPLNL